MTKDLLELVGLKDFSPSLRYHVFLTFLATLSPSLIAFYLFNRTAFLNMDLARLTLLCLSLTAPILFFNILKYIIYRGLVFGDKPLERVQKAWGDLVFR